MFFLDDVLPGDSIGLFLRINQLMLPLRQPPNGGTGRMFYFWDAVHFLPGFTADYRLAYRNPTAIRP